MEEEQGRIADAIRRLREGVRWRPGKHAQHLAKRIELGHLPVGATLAEYEALIIRVVSTSTAEVFVYRWGEALYPTVVAEVEGTRWLVMMVLIALWRRHSRRRTRRHTWRIYGFNGWEPWRNWDYEPAACALLRGCAASRGQRREHLEMLQIRDRLAELEPTLTSEEQKALTRRTVCSWSGRLPSIRNYYGSWTLPHTAVNTAFRPPMVVVSGRCESFASPQG